MPIVSELSACGDTGRPLVLVDPAGAVADVYGAVAAKVVQEVAKLKAGPKGSLAIDEEGVAGVAGALRYVEMQTPYGHTATGPAHALWSDALRQIPVS